MRVAEPLVFGLLLVSAASVASSSVVDVMANMML